MKVKRMIRLKKELLDRLNGVCDKHNLYRSSFINYILTTEIEKINEFEPVAYIRHKEPKRQLQINVDEEIYGQIKEPICPRIEYILEDFLNEYEKVN